MGIGRQGSKITEENLSNFLNKNRALITTCSSTKLDVKAGDVPLGAAKRGLGTAGSFSSEILDILRMRHKFDDVRQKALLSKKNEMIEACAQLELEKTCYQNQIAILKNQLIALDEQINSIDVYINTSFDETK